MPVGLVDVSLSGDVFKCAVAAVVIENVLGASQSARTTHHGNALPDAGWPISWRWRSRQIEIHVVCDHQVEAAIAIVIDESTSCTPGFAGPRYAAPRRDFGASGLDNIFLGVDAAKDVRRGETAFLSDIREIRNGSGRSGSRFCLLRG